MSNFTLNWLAEGEKVWLKIILFRLKDFKNWLTQDNKMILCGWNFSINKIVLRHLSRIQEVDKFNFIAIHCSKNVRTASDRHIAKALLSEVNAPFVYWDSIRGRLA